MQIPISAAPATAPTLAFACYRLRFNTQDSVKLPDYAGSAWRGALGHSLKKLVCVTHEPDCKQCMLYRSCSYPYIFETPPDPQHGVMRKYNAVPHPFVLTPGENMSGLLAPDSDCQLELNLFGHANRQLPYLIQALAQAAQRGLGKQRGRLQLTAVEQQSGANIWTTIYKPESQLNPRPASNPTPPPCPEHISLQLQTPLRLKQKDHNVTPENFTFKALFSNLLRRISMLTVFHTDTPLDTDFAALSQAAEAISIQQSRLYWKEWTRYSSRQNTPLQMGGLLGSIELDGAELTPFWPYLWLGQWTHAGKGTSMGMGKYTIKTPRSDDKLVSPAEFNE